jgi:hypothetical protein
VSQEVEGKGVDAMRGQRKGKVTLRTHAIEQRPPLTIDAGVIRGRMHRQRR